MKPNFLKDKSTTLVLEKEEKQQVKPSDNKATSNKEIVTEKQQNETKTQIQSEISQKPKINLFSAKTFEVAQEKSENLNLLSRKIENVYEKEPENEIPEIQENKEIVDEDFVSFSPKPKPKKKEWKFRLKLITVIYCAVIAVMTGWVTTNFIRIANVNNTITQTQSEVSANYTKYISEIEKLDDLRENPDDNSSLIPIDEIITVTPLPLEDVTEFEKESNWFDNIINWFGNLFGG